MPTETQMVRAGWKFTGWTLSTGIAVSNSTIWLFKGNAPTTLYANWELVAPTVNKTTTDISKVYDATTTLI